jgi:hypothetical protein
MEVLHTRHLRTIQPRNLFCARRVSCSKSLHTRTLNLRDVSASRRRSLYPTQSGSTQAGRREQVFMPHCGHCLAPVAGSRCVESGPSETPNGSVVYPHWRRRLSRSARPFSRAGEPTIDILRSVQIVRSGYLLMLCPQSQTEPSPPVELYCRRGAVRDLVGIEGGVVSGC